MNRTLLLALASGTPLAAQQSTTFHFQCGANARHGARALAPRSVTFYLTRADVATGRTARFQMSRDEWSIHFAATPDGAMFAGDGGDSTQVARARNGRWIYLFRPQGDRLVSERLVDMRHLAYRFEPNVHFSPDARWVVFRANFEGDEQVYAVEVRPAAP